jgi:hypothetical protein
MSTSFALAWEDYRKRRRRFLIAWLAGPPLVFLVGYVHTALTDTTIVFWFAAVVLIIMLFVTGINLGAFRCPRCGELFFNTKWVVNNQFRKTCGNCGFRKWAEAA